MHWLGYLAVAAITVLAGAGGYAVAATRTDAIHACAAKRTGALRLAKSCNRHERAVSWAKVGPAGAAGARGSQGSPGTNGQPGAPATKLFVLDDINGNVVRSSGGVSVSQQSTNNNTNTVARTITFPAVSPAVWPWPRPRSTTARRRRSGRSRPRSPVARSGCPNRLWEEGS